MKVKIILPGEVYREMETSSCNWHRENGKLAMCGVLDTEFTASEEERIKAGLAKANANAVPDQDTLDDIDAAVETP